VELGVAGSRPVVPEGDPPPQPTPAFDLLESKFHPPLARPGIVARSTLVDRLVAARGRVISVAAPPGYGKTTVLAQLARRLAPRVAWITCDHEDNDPVVLLSAVAEA
jgi:LuxR family transcriptional regulator, maltose regulon positive regulatory protein